MHSTRGTYHDDAMLTVFLGGTGVYRRGEAAWAVGAGCVGLVMPGSDTGLLMADPAAPYDHLYCRFSGVEALRAAGRFSTTRLEPFARHPAWRELAAVLRRGLGLGVSPSRSPEDRVTRLDAVLAEALAVLEQDDPPLEAGLGGDRLLGYFQDRVASVIDLDRAEEELGVSRSTLTRRCRASLGVSVQRAWEGVKLDWADVLLNCSGLTVGEVARRVGYDPFYFSRVYTRRRGRPPSETRQWTITAS